MMKIIIKLLFATFCATVFSVSAFAGDILPKVSIAGQDYFVYESKKGDSLYGISNRFGWNVQKLMEMNPSLVRKLAKGSKVYYPVDPAADSLREVPMVFSAESYPVIQHVVRKGDSVYSIAKMYDVPVEKIYLYNPDSKYGIKRGSVITIPQEPDAINGGQSFLYYGIRPGDTLGKIAETYNTSIEQLMRDNKGISDENFEAGDLLRVKVNSKKDEIVVETVDETKMAHVDTYIASKNDTWESVAEKTGADIDKLKDLNAGTELKKNARISVPVIVTSHVEREVVQSDERENSADGIRDIYNDVHMLESYDDSVSDNTVSLAILIEDPLSKRDNEFTRGALLAINSMKNSPFKIRLKLLQDIKSIPDSTAFVKAISDSLDSFGPDLVVATYEKNFPEWLAQYGEEKGVEIVNSFDVKNELYMENPSMIHLLTPSAYFSEEVAEWLNSSFGDYKILTVGKKDSDDAFAEAILSKNVNPVENVAVDDLAGKKLDEWGYYLIYGYPTSRDEVSALLNAVAALKEANPLANIKVLGRLNWITFADGLKDQFAAADVYFPSRFFFDNTSDESRQFIAEYSSFFGHGPIKAFPTYAISGYDITRYFIQGLASNEGDFNKMVPDGKELQTPINLKRVGNWSGFFNPSAYIIRYAPYGGVEKILIGK